MWQSNGGERSHGVFHAKTVSEGAHSLLLYSPVLSCSNSQEKLSSVGVPWTEIDSDLAKTIQNRLGIPPPIGIPEGVIPAAQYCPYRP